MTQLKVSNPFTGAVLGELPFHQPEEIAASIQAARATFQKWRYSSAAERSHLLKAVAQRLESQKEEFAQLICQEAGKPILLARAEVTRALTVLEWAAAETQRFSGELLRLDVGPASRSGFGIHTRFPKGVVLGITPFNFPLNLVMHKVAPAVACGCTILIKPSPYTPLTALKLARLFEEQVPGLVQVVLADDSASAALTCAPEVAQISFTGSTRVGWLIRKQAPEKPTTLELGGNAWVVVMEDTPASYFPGIAKRISQAAFGYAGQSCISIQNIAVSASRWKEFEIHLKETTETTPYGNPELPEVVSGPVISSTSADRIRNQLKHLPAGTSLVSSQKQLGSSSQPTRIIPPSLVLWGQKTPFEVQSPLVQEEIFGPVVTARKFEEVPQIIQAINSSPYGLQAGVYTQNLGLIEQLYRELEVGGLIVNDVPTTRYDHQPYGGVKNSGQGREGIRYAMEEMTESKFLALSSKIPT